MKQTACPICNRASADGTAPFCSSRCREVDLNRWLGGAYRVKTDEKPQDSAQTEDDI